MPLHSFLDSVVDHRESHHRERPEVPMDHGEKLNYDPQWKGPLQIERKLTDLKFVIAMVIYFAIWICIGIFAFRTGDVDVSGTVFQLRYFYPIYSPALSIALGFTIFGFCLTFTFFFLLRRFPGVVVIISIFVNMIGLLIDIIVSLHLISISNDPQHRFEDAYDLFISIVLFPVILIMYCVYYKKVLIVCRVIKESTEAIVFFPSSFLFPILPWIICAISTVFAAGTMLFLRNHPETDSEDGMPLILAVFHLTNICAYMWMLNFLYAFSQMTLSGAFATWYWTADRKQVPKRTILKFMYITSRYHLGTLAFGSLILTIVNIIKFFVWLSEKSHKKRDHPYAGLGFCCKGMWDLTEDCIEYINTNAYIMCVIHGKTFVRSAIDAFNLLWRNIIKVLIVTSVSMFILFSGTLFVVGLSLLATYAYCQNVDHIVLYGALIIVFLTTSAITTSVFGVLNIAVHTIFLCVLEDYERNDGSANRPYFMTHELKQLIIQDEQSNV